MKKLLIVILILAMSMSMAGCYWNDQVSTSQVGLRMNDGVSISDVVGPGRYTDMSWYASMNIMDASSKSLTWSDPDLWTKDKQAVSFGVSVTYARKTDPDSVKAMWERYNNEAKNDEALFNLVAARIPRIAKQVTASLTLDEMLGIAEGAKNRETMQDDLYRLLEKELSECYVQLIDIGVNDIGVDANYAQKLSEKASARIEVELSVEKTKQLEEQIKQERAQTEVGLEVARRNNLVAEEEAKVYSISPEAYELKRLELLQGVVGKSDKIYFVPEGADLTLYLAGQQQVPPLVNQQTTP